MPTSPASGIPVLLRSWKQIDNQGDGTGLWLCVYYYIFVPPALAHGIAINRFKTNEVEGNDGWHGETPAGPGWAWHWHGRKTIGKAETSKR